MFVEATKDARRGLVFEWCDLPAERALGADVPLRK